MQRTLPLKAGLGNKTLLKGEGFHAALSIRRQVNTAMTFVRVKRRLVRRLFSSLMLPDYSTSMARRLDGAVLGKVNSKIPSLKLALASALSTAAGRLTEREYSPCLISQR